MQSLTLTAPGSLQWQQMATPELSQHGAIVRPIAVSTCDFDHHLMAGNAGLPLPLSIGHECVAEVVSLGSEVNSFNEGDKVIVSFQINCGQCHQCKRGRTSSCENVPWLSCFGLGALAGNWGGAMSDFLSVPYADAMLVPLPDGLLPEHATCLTCNMPDAYRCVAPQLQKRPGSPVIIFAGKFDCIALYSIAIAKSLGAEQVDAFGIHKDKQETVEALGGRALQSEKEIPENHYPIVVDASMDTDRLFMAIEAAAPTAELTLSTMYKSRQTPLPLMRMFEKCLSLSTGQPDVRQLLDPCLSLLTKHQNLFNKIIDKVVPWDQAPSAFSSAVGKQVVRR